MSDKEKFYDEQIAPELLRLAKACQEQGLSAVFVVEWAPGEIGRTTALEPDACYALRLAEASVRSRGNIDALLLGVMKHAKTHGHSSMFLHQLGVPTTPGDPHE